LTGADLYALCSDALLIAIRDQVSVYEKMEPAKLEQLKKQDVAVDVVVEQKHFLEALKRLTPSVSFEELKRYQEMADKYTLKK
jgi:SpoVK/Ycf46/Vps4 family AAA+-type ATPase